MRYTFTELLPATAYTIGLKAVNGFVDKNVKLRHLGGNSDHWTQLHVYTKGIFYIYFFSMSQYGDASYEGSCNICPIPSHFIVNGSLFSRAIEY